MSEPESIHEEDRFKDLPEFTVDNNDISAPLFSKDGLHLTNHLTLSSLPDRIGDTMEHKPYGFALKWTFRF